MDHLLSMELERNIRLHGLAYFPQKITTLALNKDILLGFERIISHIYI